MDTKRLILSVTLMLGLVLGWQLTVAHFVAKHPGWAHQAEVTPTTVPTVVSAAPAEGMPATTGPTTFPALATATAGWLQAVGAPVATPATLGSHSGYPMVLEIDPQGAGVASITLNDFFESARAKSPTDHPLFKFQQPIGGLEAETRPLATRSVTVNKQETDAANINWALTNSSVNSATYLATINASGKAVLEITKTFNLVPKDSPDKSMGYDVAVKQNFRNLSDKPISVISTLNGPTPPARENDRSEDRRYIAGYDDGDKTVEMGSAGIGDMKKDKPPIDLVTRDPRPLLWAGTCSSYFEAILRPDYAGVGGAPAVKIASISLSALDAGSVAANSDYPTSMAVVSNEFTLLPGAGAPFDLHAFFGPKQRKLLNDSSYYAAFPMQYGKSLVYAGGFCGFITFPWLINALYGILAFFHFIFRDWGIAIICLVCLVRTMLHPITKKSQINMLQMGKMGPEIERLKKKYGDNKDELNKAMMQVYKQQGLTPILGCLPMFLQTPIWIALWAALQSTFELRQAPFLWLGPVHLTWIADLSHPDALITFPQPISILGYVHLSSLNILPLLLAGVFFIQQTMTPAPANMTPEQEQQRKMMRWMSLLFPIMLYSGPSGLNLYILTSTTIGIIESKIIRDHIKARDEAEKAGRIIVDAAPTRASKRRRDDDFGSGSSAKSGKDPKKPGGISGWLAELQAKAEDIRRDAGR